MLLAASLSSSLIVAAPVSFFIGFVLGLGLSSSFQIVRKRDYDKLAREHEARELDRDYSHDRPSRHPKQ